MKKLRIVISTLLVLSLALALFGCAGSGSPTTATSPSTNPQPSSSNTAAPSASTNSSAPPASADTSTKDWVSYTVGVTGYLGRLVDGVPPLVNFMAADCVYNVLWYNDPVTGKVVSDVLEDISMEDATTWVLKLKPGVYFSNGDEATADDVIFSFMQYEMRNSPKLANYGLIDDQCVARDRYTAVFKTKLPFPSFTDNTISLYDKAWAESVGFDSQEWEHPVGSGPYYCYEYVMDDHITLRLRDDYWDKANSDYHVDEWIIKYYPDESTMFMDLELGNIVWCDVGITDYSRYVAQGGNGYECLPILNGVPNYFSFGFACTDIWNDIAVRKAVAYGVDWNALGVAQREDLSMPLTSTVSSKSKFHIDVGTYEFNPDLAKQTLADAGYKPGDINVHLYIMDQPLYKPLAEGFQYYCSQIGINVTIDYGDTTSAQQKWTGDDPPDGGFFEFVAGSLSGDPLWIYGLMVADTGYKWLWVKDPAFKQQLIDAVYCADPDQQMQRYHDIQQKIYDEYLVMPINESVSAYGYRTDVFTKDQMQQCTITNAYLWLSKLSKSDSGWQ